MPTRDSLAAYLGSGGELVKVTVPDPAAGAEIPATAVPAGVEWKLLAGGFSLTPSGAAGNRDVFVQMGTPGGPFEFNGWAGETLGPANFARYNIGIFGYTLTAIPTFFERILLATPDCRWPAGDTIFQTEVFAGLQAGDQFSDITLLIEQWRL